MNLRFPILRLLISRLEDAMLRLSVNAKNSPTTAEVAREDGTARYQLALTSLQLLTGAI